MTTTLNKLKRIIADKRALVLPLTVAVVGNAALYTLVVYPLTIRVANAERRAVIAQQRGREAEREQAVVDATLAGKARADEDLRRFYRDVLPRDLAGARRITYARLAALAEEAHLRHERRSTTTEQDRDSHLARLRTTMVLAGNYADIRRFIYELETAREFVVIEDVSLTQREEDSAALVLTLQVSTYYWTEREDA